MSHPNMSHVFVPWAPSGASPLYARDGVELRNFQTTFPVRLAFFTATSGELTSVVVFTPLKPTADAGASFVSPLPAALLRPLDFAAWHISHLLWC